LQEPVDREERQMGKRVNFSIVYGAGSSKIGKDAGLTSKEAQDFLKRCAAQLGKLHVIGMRSLPDGSRHKESVSGATTQCGK
jgi:hypothetical protein